MYRKCKQDITTNVFFSLPSLSLTPPPPLSLPLPPPPPPTPLLLVLPVVTLSFPDGLRRNVGSDLVVLCIATGEPPVERIELLQNGVSVENTTGSTLSFSQSNLQLSDNGTPYICRAFNTRGNMSSSESFDVIVQGLFVCRVVY